MSSGKDAYEAARVAKAEVARWKSMYQNAVAGQRLVREAICELFGPHASLESEEATLLRGPEPIHEAEAQVAALRRAVAGPRVRHRRRGSSYRELGRGTLQSSVMGVGDGSPLVAYQSEDDGVIYFRHPHEFDDPDRFEKLPDAE